MPTLADLAAPEDHAVAARVIALALRDHGKAMPPVVFDALASHYPVPVQKIETAAEALYAAALAATDPAEREAFFVACARLAGMCVQHGWHHLGGSDRGPKMIGACRRELGLGKQKPSLDPQVDEAFLPPSEDLEAVASRLA